MMLNQMQGSLQQAPEPVRPALQLLIDRIQQRVDALTTEEDN
jgi:hypothetical protein